MVLCFNFVKCVTLYFSMTRPQDPPTYFEIETRINFYSRFQCLCNVSFYYNNCGSHNRLTGQFRE